MKTALELFHLDAWKYPLPDNYETVTYYGDPLWTQWTLWETVVSNLSRNVNQVIKDPSTDKEYTYSVSWNRNNFQVLNLLETDLVLNWNILDQTNAASSTRVPQVSWVFNGLYVKTDSYIVPIPSLITSEELPTWLWMVLDNTNIKSQITTGWLNLPKTWNTESSTWWLNIKLSVFTWAIDKTSTDAKKQEIAELIKATYSWSTLVNKWLYKKIIESTTVSSMLTFIDTVILEQATELTLCWEILDWWTKDFYDVSWVDAWQTCTSHKKTFTCNNTVWKDWWSTADTWTYSKWVSFTYQNNKTTV